MSCAALQDARFAGGRSKVLPLRFRAGAAGAQTAASRPHRLGRRPERSRCGMLGPPDRAAQAVSRLSSAGRPSGERKTLFSTASHCPVRTQRNAAERQQPTSSTRGLSRRCSTARRAARSSRRGSSRSCSPHHDASLRPWLADKVRLMNFLSRARSGPQLLR